MLAWLVLDCFGLRRGYSPDYLVPRIPCVRAALSSCRSGAVALLAVCLLLGACAKEDKMRATDFVGTWKSSRSTQPIVLLPNGEWEIRDSSGNVLEYGIWRYQKGQLIWSFKKGDKILDDTNPVRSVTAKEFVINELNGSTTVFRRLPPAD